MGGKSLAYAVKEEGCEAQCDRTNLSNKSAGIARVRGSRQNCDAPYFWLSWVPSLVSLLLWCVTVSPVAHVRGKFCYRLSLCTRNISVNACEAVRRYD